MVEMTINTLVKVIIGVFVMVAVILGIYLSFNNYIIPYFSGFTFNESYGGGVGVCDETTINVGILDSDGFFILTEGGQDEKSPIRFTPKGAITYERTVSIGWPIDTKYGWEHGRNPTIGHVYDADIEIHTEDAKTQRVIDKYGLEEDPDYISALSGSLIGGRQICRFS